jgi:hypothetical protein
MNFEPGSIIKRSLGGWCGLFYYHMGVYIGDGAVIHFNGEKPKSKSARVCKDTLEQFTAGKPVKLHAAPRNAVHAQAICTAALAHYQNEQNGFNDRYDFFNNNCESFCVSCYEVGYVVSEV